VELCCQVKRRVACRLRNKDLDRDPYTCRQLGCCYDASGQRQKEPEGYGTGYVGYASGRRQRAGKYGRGGGGGRGYGAYGGDGYEQYRPRCYKTRRSEQTTFCRLKCTDRYHLCIAAAVLAEQMAAMCYPKPLLIITLPHRPKNYWHSIGISEKSDRA